MQAKPVQQTFGFELRTVGDDIFLDTGTDQWRVLLSGVRRISPDWFVHVVAIGPRVCAFTVRVSTPPNDLTSVRLILGLISDWLNTGDLRPFVFLEAAPAAFDAAQPRHASG